MSQAKSKSISKNDFELLFKDSAEYFVVENAKMIQEGYLLRFICFDENDKFKEDTWFPVNNIHRIKRYCK